MSELKLDLFFSDNLPRLEIRIPAGDKHYKHTHILSRVYIAPVQRDVYSIEDRKYL